MESEKQNDFFISHLHIENFMGIEMFDEDFSRFSNNLVGINGAGKSSILRAIDILFSWFAARIRNAKGNGIVLQDSDITNGRSECLLEISLGNGVSWTLYKQLSSSRKKQSAKTKLSEMMVYINKILIDNEDHPETNSLPLYTYYGIGRVVGATPDKFHKYNALEISDVYNRNLMQQPNYNAFFNWFNERESMEDKEYRRNEDFQPDRQLVAVRKAIEGVLPGYSNLYVKSSPHTFVIEKDSIELLFDQLSDGEKALIALAGDTARKLAMTHPHSCDPSNEPGIVLIDELDLHLHPSWQRDVLPRMRKAFPRCQFIISTHSPFVLTNVNSKNNDSLFLMSKGRPTRYTSNIYGREISQIVAEVLEMPRPNSI